MKNYYIFLKKEMFESARTYKLLVLGAVFLFFGMVSPLAARFMPEIIKWAMGMDPSTTGMDLSAMISEPAALDSWVQFFGSNIGQIGLIVIVVMFSGMLSSELSNGTLTIMLSKGLSRTAVVLSKLTNAVIAWTGCYAAAFLTAWGYTAYMFPGGGTPNLLLATFCLWAFGVFLLALTTLMAAALNKGYACILCVGAAVIILFILNIIPQVAKYNPASLAGATLRLISDSATPRHVIPALAASAVGVAAFTTFAVLVFSKNKKKAGRKAAILASAAALCIAMIVFVGEEAPRQISVGRTVVTENIVVGEGTEWELSGRLTLPRNAEGKAPAVVLVHGSGANDMDETIFDNKPFRDIAEYLSSNGIAVIRYNKRTLTHGMKLSEQDAGGFSVWEETIEDAILATEILRADPRIDNAAIYILGHSLGGMLAPRIHAMGGDYAGIIIFAGSPRFLFDISRDQVMALVDETEDESEKASILEARGQMEEEFETALSLSDEEVKNSYFRHLGDLAFYWKDLHDHPIASYIDMIDVPFLVMQPEDDVQVLAGVDFAMYKELLGGRDNVAFRLYPGLNHLFMPSTGRGISDILDEYRIKARVDANVLHDLAEWVKNRD